MKPPVVAIMGRVFIHLWNECKYTGVVWTGGAAVARSQDGQVHAQDLLNLAIPSKLAKEKVWEGPISRVP